MSRRHFVRRGDQRTVCGKAAIRYDADGKMISWLNVTSNPNEVTCRSCYGSPYLDSDLGNVNALGTGYTR